ncbi:hypothetical protein [Haloarchaeobius iranensis]|uniref:Lipoprotein n=1 Tax=Haloarchaeobius iranensis TaxID=996166 RepID=A0A1G9TYZ4_9EURY|nr:hypothetical protein [Haloarchaeobius iranensis]SDM53010.1 hypothetical protein SAMN05192554_103217 [Haloarchaeobius iranensis]
MNRRTAVKAATTATVAFSGCLGALNISSSTQGPPAYVHAEFTVLDESRNTDEEIPDLEDPPRVRFNRGDGEILVFGSLRVGSGNCSRAALDSITYDEETKVLTVAVGTTGVEPENSGCEGDESVDSYRLTITFDENYPEEVQASEEGEHERTTVSRP